MNIGDMGVPFIYKGEELIYPEYVKDGLVLHYDFSGMTNNDTSKDIARDLSGNGNHGTLQNFNFTPESGYDKNKLLFDGVDDFLQLPETGLNPENMAVVDNGKIYSYEGSIVSSIGTDGTVKSSGVNLLKLNNISIYSGSVSLESPVIRFEDTRYYISFREVVLKPNTVYRFMVGEVANTGSPAYSDNFRLNINTVNDSTSLEVVGMLSSNQEVTFSLTDEEVNSHNSLFSISMYVGSSVGGTGFIENPVLIEDSETPLKTIAPQDYLVKNYSRKEAQNLLLYNRPLSPSEITHNYKIEKERFDIK